ncbi:MAG: HAD hydrolase-like protein [Lachnospiraceae bacterium]|nr:HAD hydrolase-like protein [Lachnospiraceae bacterium]
MRYKYLLFDLDGTLVQSEFGIVESAMYAFEKLGEEVPDKEVLMKFIGPPLFYSFHEIGGLSREKSEQAVSLYRSYYEKGAYKKAPVYEGMERVLHLLEKAGCVPIVVTGKITSMAKQVMENAEIIDHFAGIFGPKPDEKLPRKADLIRFAMSALHIEEPDNTIMIGDRIFDIEGANEVGIDSVGCVYGYGTRDELANAGATHLVYNPYELLSIVRGE